MTSSGDWRRAATTDQLRSVVRTIDPSVAHIARIQDYWLGGKDHFEADRLAGDEAIAQLPDMVASVRNTRAFLGRTVRFLAKERGIRQFLDIGTGIPTASNTHEVAQGVAPESRIVYVDNDPMVLAHARALLSSSAEGRCAYIDADIRHPEKILNTAAEVLDLTDPEPLPDGHPLWSAPGLLLTPHVGGAVRASRKRAYEIVATQLARLAAGQPLLNVIGAGGY